MGVERKELVRPGMAKVDGEGVDSVDLGKVTAVPPERTE
jgi:hypothetical protein